MTPERGPKDERKANKRFGITPSLIARYTTGTALGLKVRSKFLPDDVLVIAAAVTNGSNTIEQFHFYDEIDSNAGKTASGRVSLKTPTLISVEVGLSGSWGSQDRATTSTGKMWFVGADVEYSRSDLAIRAEVLKGKSPALIRQSILDPNAVIAPGYQANIMPPNFRATLSAAQINALVAFRAKVANK